MKNNSQKGFIVPAIIALMVLLVAGGAYVMWKGNVDKEITINQIASSTNQDMSRWKTYTNKKYGFSFQYPSDWTLKTVSPSESVNWVDFYSSNSTNTAVMTLRNPIREVGDEGMEIIKTEKQTLSGGEYINEDFFVSKDNFPYTHFIHVTWNQDNWNSSGELWFSFIDKDSQLEKVAEGILSTFKLTSTSTTSQNTEPTPVITSISPSSGPIGTTITIKGTGLSGFEGDLGATFERADGKKIALVDTFGDYAITHSDLIKVIVKEPCQEGQTILGEYSGNPMPCDYVQMIPGVYKVYAVPWGKTSNTVNFTVTPSSVISTSNWQAYMNSPNGFSVKYPTNFSANESQGAGFFDEQNLYDLLINAPADYQKNTDFNIGRVEILVSSSTVKCYTSSPNGGNLSASKIINGISFYYNPQQPFEDDAMGGQKGKYSLFATIHNGKCYRIEKVIGYRDAHGFSDPPYPPHFDEQKANTDLDNIISTFTFTN